MNKCDYKKSRKWGLPDLFVNTSIEVNLLSNFLSVISENVKRFTCIKST
jgi:hypothetical protein